MSRRPDASQRPIDFAIWSLFGSSTLWFLSGISLADEPEALYQRSIRPVLHERCIACHGALKQEAGLRLDTAEAAIRGGQSGATLNVDQPEESLILQRIASRDTEERMPPEGEPLRDDQVQNLREWIASGAPHPENEPSESDPTEHWAFQPPRWIPPPVLAGGPGELHATSEQHFAPVESQHWIDAWLEDSRQKQGLVPQSPASDAIWIRRITFDLIGLPPTPEEWETLSTDREPGARERVVDRLLADPAYGERWGRHWMDIWRYSDWWGLGEEVRNSQKHLWHWRDWIVESLNDDVGYDQMIREMLAADELYPNDLQRLRATGYLARQYFKFNRTSWLDETLEHTAKGMLGLTLNCAKCHDHKYDPIEQTDYYRFRAIFEPYQVRMDVLPGQYDLAVDGLPRAFDCSLTTPTYVHRRGDDRNPDLDRVMQPGVPPFLLQGNWEPQEILLPPEAVQPGLRPHVRDAALARADAEIARCNTALDALPASNLPNSSDAASAESTPEVAEPITSDLNALRRIHLERDRDRWRAEAESIPARYHADWLTATDPESDARRQAVSQAARLDRIWEWHEALVALAQSELDFASAPADKQSEAASKKKVAAELVEQKMKQIDAPGDRYRSLRGAEKTAESNLESEESRQRPFPERSTGRRTALAQWLTDHQNPLVARVAVNHIWNRHFHAPLVPTVFDFGRKGSPPSHPELLDNLAVDWMRNGWSMKRLHRSLLTSSAYAMASSSQGIPVETLERDPENRSYWRMNSGRMEAQVVRDSLLALGERLDRRLGGPSVPSSRSDTRRRSLYYFQSHNDHERFLSLFDDANVLDCYRRARSVVPQQALALQNSPLTQQACQDIVDRLRRDIPELDDQAFVQTAFQYLLGTCPTEAEMAAARKAMQRWRESAQSRQADSESLARAGLVRSLINHNDFVTIR